MKEIKLPSGAVLGFSLAPITEGRALYRAAAAEMRGVSVGADTDLAEAVKNVMAISASSELIDKALWPCVLRCTYDGEKITLDLFEDEGRRGDYTDVMGTVLAENLRPFTRSLTAQFRALYAGIM